MAVIKTKTTFALHNETCRVGQEVKTPPFHGGITGSSPVRGTNRENDYNNRFPCFHLVMMYCGNLTESYVISWAS